VAEVLPLSDAELGILRSLVRHRVRFMIVGLSAAALQGAPVVTEGVDLWFEDLHDPALLTALREVGAAYVPPFELNPPMLTCPGAQPFDIVLRMDGLGSFAEEARHAREFTIGGVCLNVLPLARILASKEVANRPKDRLVAPVLRDALLAQQERQSGSSDAA
jgi:hypothetical protein